MGSIYYAIIPLNGEREETLPIGKGRAFGFFNTFRLVTIQQKKENAVQMLVMYDSPHIVRRSPPSTVNHGASRTLVSIPSIFGQHGSSTTK